MCTLNEFNDLDYLFFFLKKYLFSKLNDFKWTAISYLCIYNCTYL